ncbi:MAG TPA: hypothetical protein VFP55_14650 [Solirubrobacteraceae bacterium]|nr:hypothetical protein [Solirubrobacteraceae bacterium]
MVSRALGALLTGPAAFFLSGLVDVLVGLRLAAIYLWRTRTGSRHRPG